MAQRHASGRACVQFFLFVGGLLVASLSGWPADAAGSANEGGGTQPATPLVKRAASSAQTNGASSERGCTDRAARAKEIAEDRDAGIERQAELSKVNTQWSSRPPAQRDYETPSTLAAIVNGVYGPYAAIPAARIYEEYLRYCKARWQYDASGQ